MVLSYLLYSTTHLDNELSSWSPDHTSSSSLLIIYLQEDDSTSEIFPANHLQINDTKSRVSCCSVLIILPISKNGTSQKLGWMDLYFGISMSTYGHSANRHASSPQSSRQNTSEQLPSNSIRFGLSLCFSPLFKQCWPHTLQWWVRRRKHLSSEATPQICIGYCLCFYLTFAALLLT